MREPGTWHYADVTERAMKRGELPERVSAIVTLAESAGRSVETQKHPDRAVVRVAVELDRWEEMAWRGVL